MRVFTVILRLPAEFVDMNEIDFPYYAATGVTSNVRDPYRAAVDAVGKARIEAFNALKEDYDKAALGGVEPSDFDILYVLKGRVDIKYVGFQVGFN